MALGLLCQLTDLPRALCEKKDREMRAASWYFLHSMKEWLVGVGPSCCLKHHTPNALQHWLSFSSSFSFVPPSLPDSSCRMMGEGIRDTLAFLPSLCVFDHQTFVPAHVYVSGHNTTNGLRPFVSTHRLTESAL